VGEQFWDGTRRQIGARIELTLEITTHGLSG
jgi:hypothetical protein